MTSAEWPWYEIVSDDSLDQGDIIPGCLVFYAVEGQGGELVSEFRPVTALVLTQTCDLAQAKVASVVVCAVWSITSLVLQETGLRKEATETAQRCKLPFPSSLAAPDAEAQVGKIIERSKSLKKEFNAIMKGERPPFAMVAKHEAPPALPLSLANFQQVYSLPRTVLTRAASNANPRLRLLPPYREYISQAFGRYFSRIGLMQDIPRFST